MSLNWTLPNTFPFLQAVEAARSLHFRINAPLQNFFRERFLPRVVDGEQLLVPIDSIPVNKKRRRRINSLLLSSSDPRCQEIQAGGVFTVTTHKLLLLIF